MYYYVSSNFKIAQRLLSTASSAHQTTMRLHHDITFSNIITERMEFRSRFCEMGQSRLVYIFFLLHWNSSRRHD